MNYKMNFRVSCTDVNRHNKLKPQALINYLQDIAGTHSDSVGDGLNYLDVNENVWILLNWKVRIFETLKWGQNLTVKTWSRKADKLYAYRDFEVYDEKENKIAIATSKWVVIDYKTENLKKIEDSVISKYESEDIMVFEKEIGKLKDPDEMEFKYSYTILERDIDVNGHVNNSYYIDFAMEVLENDVNISDIEVLYKKQCKIGEVIDIYYADLGNSECIIIIKSHETNQTSALVRFKIKQ